IASLGGVREGRELGNVGDDVVAPVVGGPGVEREPSSFLESVEPLDVTALARYYRDACAKSRLPHLRALPLPGILRLQVYREQWKYDVFPRNEPVVRVEPMRQVERDGPSCAGLGVIRCDGDVRLIDAHCEPEDLPGHRAVLGVGADTTVLSVRLRHRSRR